MNDVPKVGERVVDMDASDPDTAIVVARPDKRADEWDVGEHTVASFPGNEQYPADAPVVVVVYEPDADEYGIDAADAPIKPATLAIKGIPHYAFPAPRLEAVAAPEPPEELLAIADRLRDGGMDVEVDGEEQVVRATKLGETYVVSTDGVLDGGALTDRIEAVVRRVGGER